MKRKSDDLAKREHSYNSGRIYRAGQGTAPSQQQTRTKQKKSKKGGRRMGLRIFLLVLVLVLGIGSIGALWAYFKVDSVLDTGVTGTIDSSNYTPKEYQGDVINILIVGVYREDADNYPVGMGLTDMILYVNYDLKNNQINMLQIPRDTYPGAANTDSSGKINAAMVTGANKEDPINNLVEIITSQYKLPVDRYIAIDMEGLKDIVDILGPLLVYVPQEMDNNKGAYLPQGWQSLDADGVEFFVRNRSGEGFKRADIDRLDNQRYFYSALFRRFLTLSPSDIVALLPVFEYRCTTDFKMTDMFDLAFTALKLSADDVMFCKAPGATRVEGVWEADPDGYGREVYAIDLYGRGTEEDPGLVNLLNTYFRTYGEPVTAEEMIAGGMPNIRIPDYVAIYPPNVQKMGEVQENEGGEDIDVVPPAGGW